MRQTRMGKMLLLLQIGVRETRNVLQDSKPCGSALHMTWIGTAKEARLELRSK
jgi:hypothetical protein